jgi:DNA-binding response OmpR family regulator
MHILVVEDDLEVSHSIQLMLGSVAPTVHTTDLGEEGVELAKLNPIENVYRGNL